MSMWEQLNTFDCIHFCGKQQHVIQNKQKSLELLCLGRSPHRANLHLWRVVFFPIRLCGAQCLAAEPNLAFKWQKTDQTAHKQSESVCFTVVEAPERPCLGHEWTYRYNNVISSDFASLSALHPMEGQFPAPQNRSHKLYWKLACQNGSCAPHKLQKISRSLGEMREIIRHGK